MSSYSLNEIDRIINKNTHEQLQNL